jgi:hypothetical protein
MQEFSSLAPPFLTPSDLLGAIDEHYESRELHEEAKALIERGELITEVEMLEDVELPNTSAWAAHITAVRQRHELRDRTARSQRYYQNHKEEIKARCRAYYHRKKEMASRKH